MCSQTPLLGVSLPAATAGDNLIESINKKCAKSLSKSRLGIHPREISTYVHMTHSFRKYLFST